MRKSTIKKLNQLNKNFYQKTAEEFSRSRSYFWSGWKKLLPYLNILTARKKEINVLDVGCGNGRFGLFLDENSPGAEINYLGIDFSQKLLAEAKKDLRSTKINYNLVEKDILQKLNLKSKKFDLIVCFGLIHHLASFKLRQEKLMELADYLNTGGLLVVTFWQFGNKPRFEEKTVRPDKVGLDSSRLEENDYILGWKQKEKIYRYCHYVDYREAEKLIKDLKLNLVDKYLADGKTNNLNLYLILKN